MLTVRTLRAMLAETLREREEIQTKLYGIRAQLRHAEARQKKFPDAAPEYEDVPFIPKPAFFIPPAPSTLPPSPAYADMPEFAHLPEQPLEEFYRSSRPKADKPAKPPFAEAYFMRQDITPEQITILNGMTEEARNAWLEANPPKDNAK